MNEEQKKQIADKVLKRTLEKKMNNGLDLIVETMEEVEKTKLKGEEKSIIAKIVIELILQAGKDCLPPIVYSQLVLFVESGTLESIFTSVINAGKNLKIRKKCMKCFGSD